MSFFGESHYAEAYYSGSQYRVGTELPLTILCRVVKPLPDPVDIPPVFDNWVVGLAERFNWLQQAIQVFGLANKIEYATGSKLDDQWGVVYNLLRRTAESDDDYRKRLQAFSSILTSCGTPGNLLPLLNFLIGKPSGIEIITRWPAQVIITSDSIDILRAITQYRSRLDTVLPSMFPAGVEYTVLTPYLDFQVVARVAGDRYLNLAIHAAAQADLDLPLEINAAAAKTETRNIELNAAVQATRVLWLKAKAAVVGDSELPITAKAAVMGDAGLTFSVPAAVQVERSLQSTVKAAVMVDTGLEWTQKAAVSKTFEKRITILSFVAYSYAMDITMKAAVQATRELPLTICARVRKPT